MNYQFKYYDFLCGIDKKTKTILFRYPNWNGTPRFIPTDLNLDVITFRGFSNCFISEEDFQSYKVFFDTKTRSLSVNHEEISEDRLVNFKLGKLKFGKMSEWLSLLNLELKNSEGILPGIYGVTSGSNEEIVFKYNHKKVHDLINEIIIEFHDKLWLAKTEDEFIDLYIKARSKWIL